MNHNLPYLKYLPGDRDVPDHEPQVITAVPFVQIDPRQKLHLEGLNFDRNRDMFLCNIYESAIMKVDMQTKEVSKFYEFEDKRFKPCAVKFHKDGRMFVAGLDTTRADGENHGGIYALDPDGTNLQPIIEGWTVDDLVFDSQGGIYFTNYIGSPYHPDGSIEYIAPDGTQTTVVAGLASPNGVTLSTDEKILWFTETNRGLLHRYPIGDEAHATTPYKFEGFLGPDSCSVDEDDNLYVAMARQGKVFVFNKMGFLIAKILSPGIKDGELLGTTHPIVHPDRPELYITIHDDKGNNGANVFCCGAFACGNKRYFQYQ